jgi:hypothetical protein
LRIVVTKIVGSVAADLARASAQGHLSAGNGRVDESWLTKVMQNLLDRGVPADELRESIGWIGFRAMDPKVSPEACAAELFAKR